MARNLTYDEFLARAQEAGRRDPRLHRHLKSLLAEHGVLAQLLHEVLALRNTAKDVLASQQMISDEAIRIGIGQQGVVRGIDQVLETVYNLTLEDETDGDGSSTDE